LTVNFHQDKASLAAELEALRVGARARDEQRQQDQERISHLVRELEQAKVQTIDLQRSVSRTGNLEVEHERLARLVSDREELDRLDAKVHAQARDMLAYQEDLDEMVQKLRRLQAERNEIAENLNETMTIIEDKNEELRESQDQLDQVDYAAQQPHGAFCLTISLIIYRHLINWSS
jgi:chromosome segregation ATPase